MVVEFGVVSSAPLTSSSSEAARPGVELRFVNDSRRALVIAWVDALGVLRHSRPCSPGRGRLRIDDGSVRPEHVELSFVGDAFVVFAASEGPFKAGTTNDALASAERRGDATIACWYVARETTAPEPQRIVTIRDAGLWGSSGFVVSHAAGAPRPPTSAKRDYAYERTLAGGFDVDVDVRLDVDSDDVAVLLADVAAASARLPAASRASLCDATRVVAHANTSGVRRGRPMGLRRHWTFGVSRRPPSTNVSTLGALHER